MRYFTYVSDAKVDMLLPQVLAKEQESIAAEIGFDLKVLKGSIKSDRKNAIPEDSINRMLIVEKQIHKQYKVGTVTHPESWIQGKGFAIPTKLHDDKRAIFYFMRQQGVYLALGGSLDHVIGQQPDKKMRIGYSYAPDLIHSLLNFDMRSKLFHQSDKFLSDWVSAGVAGEEHPWGNMIYDMCHPRQERTFKTLISFLAKTLDVTTHNGYLTILATPLFVELIEI